MNYTFHDTPVIPRSALSVATGCPESWLGTILDGSRGISAFTVRSVIHSYNRDSGFGVPSRAQRDDCHPILSAYFLDPWSRREDALTAFADAGVDVDAPLTDEEAQALLGPSLFNERFPRFATAGFYTQATVDGLKDRYAREMVQQEKEARRNAAARERRLGKDRRTAPDLTRDNDDPSPAVIESYTP